MAQHRQDVRQFVPGQELVAPERLFGHRGRKGRNGKSLPKRRRQNGITRSQRREVWLGAQMPSMQGTKKGANPPHQQKPMEGQQQQKPLPKLQITRPNTLNMTKTKQQWEQETEKLNEEYNHDCFSDSELDSESDEDEQYHYQHRYKTLI